MTLDQFNETLQLCGDFFDNARFNLFIGRDNVVISVYNDGKALCNIKFDQDFYVHTISVKLNYQELACDISNPRVSYKDKNMTAAEESAIKAIIKLFK